MGDHDDELPLDPGRRAGAELRRLDRVRASVPCTYDLEVAARSTSTALADGEAPLRFHFNGTVFYEAADGRMQISGSRGTARPRYAMPVDAGAEMIDRHYPYRAWIPVHTDTLER